MYEAIVRDLVEGWPITRLYVSPMILLEPPFGTDPSADPNLAGLLPETVSNFKSQLPHTPSLSLSLSLQVPVHVVPAGETPEICAMPGPFEACEDRQGIWGLVELSAAGFSKSGTQALVYARMFADGACGGGYY